MKSFSENGGLSARRTTISYTKNYFSSIKPLGVFMLAATLLLSSCKEETHGQNSVASKKNAPDSLHKPKVNIQVNRLYDNKGNVIGFDSTYTSYYSNVIGDTVQMDSLMKSFDRYFGSSHRYFFDDAFAPLFFSDSLRHNDFFHDDFFMKRYELNDDYLRRMMRQMDSIKNQFYQDRNKGSADGSQTL